MNRGDVWLINLGGRIGNRPVVVLTRQNVLDYLNKVTVAEITTRGKGYPTEIYVGQKANLPKPSLVQAGNFVEIVQHILSCENNDRSVADSSA